MAVVEPRSGGGSSPVPGSSPVAGPTPPAEDEGPRAEMPAWIPKLLFEIVAAVALTLAAYWFLGKVRDLIIWLVVALFLSFALEPAVNYLVKRGWRRGLATGAVLLLLVIIGTVIIGAMTPLIVSQIQSLIHSIPGWLDRINVYTTRWFRLNVSSERLITQLGSVDASVKSYATNIAGNVLGFGAKALTAVFEVLTIGLFTFYLVADGPRFRRAICSLLRPERQREVLKAWEIAIDKTGGYFYSRLLLGAIAGVSIWIVLLIIHVPFSLPLALWLGFFSTFVPIVGTYIGAAIPILVAVLDDPWKGLVVLLYILVYQQVENYILSPRITARTMSLHPAVAFGSAIAGASMLGAVGAFLALPAAAIIQSGVSSYLTRHAVMETELTKEHGQAEIDAAREIQKRRRRESFAVLRRLRGGPREGGPRAEPAPHGDAAREASRDDGAADDEPDREPSR
jgi:predicted PurR-regulated permease PerM